MTQINFLIGHGERLTSDIKGPRKGSKPREIYTFSEAKSRLIPQFMRAAKDLEALPRDACPNDFGVARLIINPSYIAKSYFPSSLLRDMGLTSVGSRTTRVTPARWTKKGTPRECSTTELFVAGKRHSFRDTLNKPLHHADALLVIPNC